MNAERLFPVVERHLLSQSEPELLLLKGHLILEQCLNEALRGYMDKPEALDKLNLSFSRKLDLLLALGHQTFSLAGDGETHIREINRIRNKLAHHLDFADYEADLKAWASSVLGYTPKSMNRRSTYINTLKKAFAFSAAFLAGAAMETPHNRTRRGEA